MLSGINNGDNHRGAYAHLEQSLVAPEGDLPTTIATVRNHNIILSF
jgi:hypothetical protein